MKESLSTGRNCSFNGLGDNLVSREMRALLQGTIIRDLGVSLLPTMEMPGNILAPPALPVSWARAGNAASKRHAIQFSCLYLNGLGLAMVAPGCSTGAISFADRLSIS